ncbi:hypothetical protein LZ32DRAFT_190054 [Colletotrichum eremochloae]|nr:hypothetical protein LZ32DRAFT_190054 [Colletotrichum eremochloae]
MHVSRLVSSRLVSSLPHYNWTHLPLLHTDPCHTSIAVVMSNSRYTSYSRPHFAPRSKSRLPKYTSFWVGRLVHLKRAAACINSSELPRRLARLYSLTSLTSLWIQPGLGPAAYLFLSGQPNEMCLCLSPRRWPGPPAPVANKLRLRLGPCSDDSFHLFPSHRVQRHTRGQRAPSRTPQLSSPSLTADG